MNRNNKIKDVVRRAKRPMKKGREEMEDLKGHSLRKVEQTSVPMLIQRVISKALKPQSIFLMLHPKLMKSELLSKQSNHLEL